MQLTSTHSDERPNQDHLEGTLLESFKLDHHHRLSATINPISHTLDPHQSSSCGLVPSLVTTLGQLSWPSSDHLSEE